MCVVPVYLKYNENCVMLDNCSTGIFIDEELLSLFGSNFLSSQQSTSSMHCVTLQSEKPARHVFVPQNPHPLSIPQQAVEESIEKMIKAVYDDEQTKNDVSLGEEFSQDVINFMKIIDNCKKVCGKYVIPLPFRNQHFTLPNNKGFYV